MFVVLGISVFFLTVNASAQALRIDLEEGGAVGEKNLDDQPLTQEEFAVELVHVMGVENLLPVAALPGDYVDLLERLGIAPFGGWERKAFLNREDYLVIIGKAQGKEGIVHKQAVAVETKNVEIINKKWEQSYSDTKQWMTLSALLNDKAYFPQGAPRSPYGTRYTDKNGDHKVDPLFLPVASLIELQQFLSTR